MLARINWKPTPREINYFAYTLIAAGVVFGLIAYFATGLKTALVVLSIGAGLGMLSRLIAPIGKGAYILWMAVTFILSLIVSPIVTGIVYYLVLTPMAVFSRISGKDELRLRKPKGAASYFVDADIDSSSESFKRQY